MIEVTLHVPIVTGRRDSRDEKLRLEFVKPKRPFLFWSSRHEGEWFDFPKGFGLAYAVAYEDPVRWRVLYAPIPFNVLIAGLIRLHFWVKVGAALRVRKQKEVL